MDEPRHAWVVVGSVFVALTVIFGVSYSFAAFFASFAAEFDANRADVSLVFGLSGLIYFVLGAGAGMLADRVGPRAVCSAGFCCIAAGLAGASLASSLAAIYAAFGVCIGIGIALVYTPAMACVQPWFTRRRGLAAGIASSGIGAGTLLLPLAASWAIAAFEWRGALRVLALGTLLVGLSAALLLRRAPAARGGASPHATGSTLAQTLRDPRFWWLYLALTASGPGMFIPFAHVSVAARDLGIDETRAVGLVGLIGIGSMVGRFGIGALADRLGRGLTLVLAHAAMGATFLVWLGAGGYAALAVFALGFGLAYGGIVSLMPALCMDHFGARAIAGVLGTLYTGAAAGSLLGPVIAGAVFDATGSYTAVLWGCLALSALAATAAAKLLALRGARY